MHYSESGVIFMKKLAISIVTYNRAKHIREDLETIAQPTKEYGIDIYIYDGSTDMRTEWVVDQYIEMGYKHIHYFHADRQLSTMESVISRLSAALEEPDSEYVWLSGDKFVVRPEYYPEILSYIEKSYDIITIYGNILNGTQRFTKVDSFANYAIVPLTHWGSTVVKKRRIEPFKFKNECERNGSFTIPLIYLRAIASCDDFKGVVIDTGKGAGITSRYKTLSSAYARMWQPWVINWYRFINLLPSAYDNVRENLYNKPDLQCRFFSLKELVRQRSEGQFDCKKYWECREYVKKVIVMPRVFVFCISLLPRCVAKWLWKIYRFGGKIFSWMKSGVRLIDEKLRGVQSNL